MSIALPAALPATRVLRQEGLQVLEPGAAADAPGAVPPLKIAVLNLMPDKIKTEIQLARLLADSGHQVELSLLIPDSYRPKNTPAAHLSAFYRRWSEVREETFDGLIVTGAPVETLAFDAVDYWDELCEIFEWASEQVHRSFYICWAAQAALHHFHGVPKHELPGKRSGIFKHRILDRSADLLDGLCERVWIPVSRHTEVRAIDLARVAGLETLIAGPETGPSLVEDRAGRAHFMFDHLEYDADTLECEYRRDLAAARPVRMPENYFPDDDESRLPVNFWRQSAGILFRNWLGEVARERRRAVCDERMLQWLARDSAGAPDGSELLVVVKGGAPSVSRVLRAVSTRRRWSRRLAWQAFGDGVLVIELGLDKLDQGALVRIARDLLKLAQIHSVAVRNPRGFGGLFRSDQRAGAGAQPNRARLKGMLSFAA